MKKNNNIMENESMKLFTMLSCYFLVLLISFFICKLLHINHCLNYIQTLSVTIPVIFYLINNKKPLKKVAIVILSYFVIILILPFIFGKTYDLSSDGNTYHKTAIAFIKNGWNPIYDNSEDFQKNNNEIVKFEEGSNIATWIDHYPKGTWIIGAVMYEYTDNIESGKSVNLIFMIMLFLLSYNVFNMIFKKWYKSLTLSLLLVLNPIIIPQIFTYYVDGLMGICFVIELLLLFLIDPYEKPEKGVWISLFSICALFVNIKFTGLLYSGLIAAVFYFYWIIKYRKKKDFINVFKKITIYFIIIFSVSIFAIGSTSYVKNAIDHHNPLYPLIGKDKVDIITTMQPKSFGDKNMIEKFAISLLSKTENVFYGGGEPKLKNPFMVYEDEIKILSLPDIRMGGFGPLSALSFIISFFIFIPILYLFIKYEKVNLKYLFLPLISIAITVILVGENWWARYIPQLYLIPIGILGMLMYLSKYFKKIKINKALILIIFSVVTLNILTFTSSFNELLITFKKIDQDLIEMKYMEDLELKLGGEEKLYGYFYNLNDKNIDYKVVDNIPDEESKYMYSWRFKIRIK